MTRDSKLESKRTGRRSSPAISSMKGSISCSDTTGLLKEHPQPLARSLDAHLQRRYANAGQLGHLLVPHFFDVLQQKRFALIVVQLSERELNLLAPRRGLFRVIFGRVEQCNLVAYERLVAPTAARPGCSAAICENPKEPRSEPRRVLTLGERSEGAHERILQRLLGILSVAEHASREPCVLRLVPGDQRRVGRGVAGEDAGYGRRITVVL